MNVHFLWLRNIFATNSRNFLKLYQWLFFPLCFPFSIFFPVHFSYFNQPSLLTRLRYTVATLSKTRRIERFQGYLPVFVENRISEFLNRENGKLRFNFSWSKITSPAAHQLPNAVAYIIPKRQFFSLLFDDSNNVNGGNDVS